MWAANNRSIEDIYETVMIALRQSKEPEWIIFPRWWTSEVREKGMNHDDVMSITLHLTS
jgi:hypothetical protein